MENGRELARYEYGADGAVQTAVHGPIRQAYTYDLDKNLTGLKVQSGERVLADNRYTYDGNGNRLSRQGLEGTTRYYYDCLQQLEKVEYPGYTEELFYDRAGNRTKRIAAGSEELYTYDARNRLTAYTKNGATTAFEYDRAGNLLRDDKAVYTYDAFNRMVKAETFDGHVQINRYDAEGLRYEMEENGRLVQLIFNTEKEVVTEESAGEVTRLIRGRELIARSTDSTRTYYHYASDEMGSITHLADEAGAIQNQYAYDAWGNLLTKEEKIPNRYTYYGQQLDQITQQYYLRARFYNPVFGRFTQEDTYRGDGLNLYAYCANNPVRYIDPTGFDKEAHKGQGEGVPFLSSEMERKILEGERIAGRKDVRGGHSFNAVNNSNPRYAVEILKENEDGTLYVQYCTQFPDGTISKLKKSTLFPDTWSDSDIIRSIKEVSNMSPIGQRTTNNTHTTLHNGTINGVEIDVIIENGNITAGYPVGGRPTLGFEPITQ